MRINLISTATREAKDEQVGNFYFDLLKSFTPPAWYIFTNLNKPNQTEAVQAQ